MAVEKKNCSLVAAWRDQQWRSPRHCDEDDYAGIHCGMNDKNVILSREFTGYAVMQLVEALHYKPEGRGFHYRWGHWDISLTLSSTRLLTETSIYLRPLRRPDKLVTFICRLSRNSGIVNLVGPSGSVQACIRIALPFRESTSSCPDCTLARTNTIGAQCRTRGTWPLYWKYHFGAL
jgi:hypothetical protein